jgi:hypothetical protein
MLVVYMLMKWSGVVVLAHPPVTIGIDAQATRAAR